MEYWRVCNVCRVKFPYNNFYTQNGDVSDTCQFCNYGTRVYDFNDPDVYITQMHLPKHFTDMVMKKEAEINQLYYDKINLYPANTKSQ